MTDHSDDFIDSVVVVTKGKHDGRVGYCDDVEDGEAYVYFGSWGDGYCVVPARDLQVAEASAEQLYLSQHMSSPERWYGKTGAA